MYFSCSFCYELIQSFCVFLRFCTLMLVGFSLLGKDAFFMLPHFSLIATDYHGTLHLALGLVDTNFAASIWVVTKFSYLLFGVCLSGVSWRVSNFFSYCYSVLISNIKIGEWGPVILWSLNCFLFLHSLRQIFAKTILWLKDIPSKEEYASQFKALTVRHSLILYKIVVKQIKPWYIQKISTKAKNVWAIKHEMKVEQLNLNIIRSGWKFLT